MGPKVDNLSILIMAVDFTDPAYAILSEKRQRQASVIITKNQNAVHQANAAAAAAAAATNVNNTRSRASDNPDDKSNSKKKLALTNASLQGSTKSELFPMSVQPSPSALQNSQPQSKTKSLVGKKNGVQKQAISYHQQRPQQKQHHTSAPGITKKKKKMRALTSAAAPALINASPSEVPENNMVNNDTNSDSHNSNNDNNNDNNNDDNNNNSNNKNNNNNNSNSNIANNNFIITTNAGKFTTSSTTIDNLPTKDKNLPPRFPNQKQLAIHKVRGSWSREEDKILMECVLKHEPKNWSLIASKIPGRTGKQARERWLNQLSPQLKKKNWEPQEDRIIIDTVRKVGNKWSYVAKLLPGRTDNSVKNRFNSTLKRIMEQEDTLASGTAVGSASSVQDVSSTDASAIITEAKPQGVPTHAQTQTQTQTRTNANGEDPLLPMSVVATPKPPRAPPSKNNTTTPSTCGHIISVAKAAMVTATPPISASPDWKDQTNA